MNYSPSQETEMPEHKQTAAAAAPPPTGDLVILIIQKIKALFILFKNISLHSCKNIHWLHPSQIQVAATKLQGYNSKLFGLP